MDTKRDRLGRRKNDKGRRKRIIGKLTRIIGGWSNLLRKREMKERIKRASREYSLLIVVKMCSLSDG